MGSVKSKGKVHPITCHVVTEEELVCICTLSLSLALVGRGCWKTQYPLFMRLGGAQGWSGWVWKIVPLLGFESQTIQPVAYCNGDYTIPVSHGNCTLYYFMDKSLNIPLITEHPWNNGHLGLVLRNNLLSWVAKNVTYCLLAYVFVVCIKLVLNILNFKFKKGVLIAH